MKDNNSKKMFWTSLPGILTGVAGLITAIVSLLVYITDGNNLSNNEPSQIKNTRNITAINTSKYIGNHLWDWKVFIEATPETLSQIEYVEYELHPTFPEPIRRIHTRHNKFALSARGWGTFEIKIQVHFYDGTEKYLTHMLVFN